jgi:glycerophosphoryl diester phosphodiesterase
MRLAHRGDWRSAPENTIPAFQAALRVPGCDGVEFDIRGSADGVPVVIHDQTLARVQRVDARAAELSAAALQRHGVPALAEVCAAVGRRPFLDVELKEWVPAVIDALDSARGPTLERASVSSFDAGILRNVGRARPVWRRWLNTVALDSGVIGRALELGCAGIAAQWRSVNERTATATRTAGLELVAWTVRRRPTYHRLERLGVAAICVEAAALDG